MKTCNKCDLEKDESKFYKHSSTRDRLFHFCIECFNVMTKTPEALAAKKARQATPEYKAVKRAYDSTPEQRVLDKLHKSTPEFKIHVRLHEKERYATDIKFKLAKNLRSRMSKAIKRNFKTGSAVRDLGCTIDELKIHLSKGFYPNPETGEEMTWDNYNFHGWHVDHIRPLASFDLTSKEELLKACHFTNLQPLWWFDNLKKSDKTCSSVESLV